MHAFYPMPCGGCGPVNCGGGRLSDCFHSFSLVGVLVSCSACALRFPLMLGSSLQSFLLMKDGSADDDH